MSILRCRISVLLIVATLVCLSDTSVFGAVLVDNRNQRAQRPSRASGTSGAGVNVQKALSVLNAARAAQASAQLSLVQTRAKVTTREKNSVEIVRAKAEHEKAKTAYEAAKAKVLDWLRKHDGVYQAALANLSATEDRRRKAQLDGDTSQVDALSVDLRKQRSSVSNLEDSALKKDDATQAATRLREAASYRVVVLNKAAEAAIAKDSDIVTAKLKVAQTSRNVSSAQSNYMRAVASANIASQVARARAMQQRYYGSNRHSHGRRHSSSRFRRYR